MQNDPPFLATRSLAGRTIPIFSPFVSQSANTIFKSAAMKNMKTVASINVLTRKKLVKAFYTNIHQLLLFAYTHVMILHPYDRFSLIKLFFIANFFSKEISSQTSCLLFPWLFSQQATKRLKGKVGCGFYTHNYIQWWCVWWFTSVLVEKTYFG